MKVTYANMGNVTLALHIMLRKVGLEVVPPPPTSKRTLDLATKHSPEFSCLPFKMMLGNFIEGMEQGADTVFTAESTGKCRFGFYSQLQEQILNKLGYKPTMVRVDTTRHTLKNLAQALYAISPSKSWFKVAQAIRHGVTMLKIVDSLENKMFYLRPRACDPEMLERSYNQITEQLSKVDNIGDMKTVYDNAMCHFRELKLRLQDADILRIGLVGEFYVVLEPAVTGHIERKLGSMGVEVSKFLFPSDWAFSNLFKKILLQDEHADAVSMASPYLTYHVGGDGQMTVGQTVLCARENYDGVIQLYPFTCMPEVVAQYMLPHVSKDMDIPILMLGVDEHTGEAGFVTRLEAFIDLLKRKKQNSHLRYQNA